MKITGIPKPRQLFRQIRKRFAARALILMYHRIAEVYSDPWSLCVTPDRFAEHLDVLQKHSHPLSLQKLTGALRKGAVPSRAVVLTFDDGYADNLYYAKPLLERHDMPATIFIASGYIGSKQRFWWDELERIILHSHQLPETLRLAINGEEHGWTLENDAVCSPKQHEENRSWRAAAEPLNDRQKLYMALWRLMVGLSHSDQHQILEELRSWAGQATGDNGENLPLSIDELISLAQSKQIEIGAHTVTHSSLTSQSISSQQNEILQSKKHLEDILGTAINHFSYPYGNYAEETIKLVSKGGFASACTTEARSVKAGTNPFKLPRFQVTDCDGDTFIKEFSQWFGK